MWVDPLAGEVMVTTGAELLTVRFTVALEVSPPLSVTDAVMIWAPKDKLDLLKEAPVPI